MYFFLPNLKIGNAQGDLVKHFVSMRILPGKVVQATDLCGNLGKIQITKIDKKTLTLSWILIENVFYTKNSNFITIFQAQTDKVYLDKFAEIIALGQVDEIFIFPAENSLKHNVDITRLQKILIHSATQSHQVYLPTIKLLTMTEFKDCIQKYNPLVLHQKGKKLDKMQINNNKVAVLVGPEGGWSGAEEKMFEDFKIPKINLGTCVLPAWVAGYAFCNIYNNY